MNELARTETFETPDQFADWRAALANGQPVAYTRGTPTAGYFKCRGRNDDRSIRWDAVAIWRAEDSGDWVCWRTGPFAPPNHADEIEELFANCNSTPISYELFMTVSQGGAWPEDVAPVETPPDLSPHEAAAAELKAQRDSATKWLADLGRNPASQDEANKAANYADAFAKLEKRADKLRETEKEPFLTAGRDVDAKWRPIIEGAGAAKKKAKGLSDDFARAETERRRQEAAVENARRQREFEEARAAEQARIENEERLRAKGVLVPEFAPPPKPVEAPRPVVAEAVRVGTGSRRQSLVKVKTYEIADATAVIRFLGERNVKSAKLLEVALSDARALAEIGIDVPGLKVFETEQIR